MKRRQILVLESRRALALWAEAEGVRLGLEVSARPSIRDLLGEMRLGRFEYVIGHPNGDGASLAELPDEVRPRLIPLFPAFSENGERRVRIGMILGAIRRGREQAEPGVGRIRDEISRWIDRNFDEEMDRRREAQVRGLFPALEALGKLDFHVKDHSRRVGHYAGRIGRALGLGGESVRLLAVGGWVHDVGKVRIPGVTLNKRGPLGPDEWRSMLAHPEWGAELIEPCPRGPALLDMVLHHHERMDGKGYPGGLRGRAIPLLARVLAVADAYDAVTHDRPYRERASHGAAIREILSHAGSQFDPDVVRALLSARLDRMPV